MPTDRSRWSRSVGIATIVILALTGCTPAKGWTTAGRRRGPEPSDQLATGAAPAVEFTASLVVADTVQVSYRLVNHSGEDLIVVNDVNYRAHNPAAVYVTGVNGTHSVQISQRVFARPSDAETFTEPVAGGVIVHPEQSIDRQFGVTLPLRRAFPYGDTNDGHVVNLPDPISDVAFCLGVIRLSNLAHLAQSDGDLLVPHEAAATRVEYLVCSAPVAL